MTIGEKIKNGRKELGLSQKEFSDIVDSKQHIISMIESDKIGVNDRLKINISRLFNKSIIELFFEDEIVIKDLSIEEENDVEQER